jgi:hypothetical protein
VFVRLAHVRDAIAAHVACDKSRTKETAGSRVCKKGGASGRVCPSSRRPFQQTPFFLGGSTMDMTRMTALSALLVVVGAGGALAQGGPGASGTVQSVDPSTRTVVLNGQAYQMAEEADMGTLRAGSTVTMSCDAAGRNCLVTAFLPANETGGKPEADLTSDGAAEGASTAGAAEGRHAPDTKEPGVAARAR